MDAGLRAGKSQTPVPSENLVRPAIIEDCQDLRQATSTMPATLLAILASFRSLLRPQAALYAEVLAPRHQLLVLERQHGGRIRLRSSDRLLWFWLSRCWSEWRNALILVQPETAVRWHCGEDTHAS